MDLIKYVDFKEELKRKLEEKLPKESIVKAIKDHHSKRLPRPCGMTIHTGIGCSLACRYCYIYDMGFPGRVTPYPLNAYEMLYALTINPYVVLGKGGTMLALGAVTEPFLQDTKYRTFEYLKTFGELGNPTQVSTKMILNDNDIDLIRNYIPNISFLMTIICISDYKKLEPNAPSPIERFETIRRLRSRNIHVTLFLRPIIPGYSDKDARELIKLCLEYNVNCIVLGTLRITENIFKKLKAVGIDLSSRVERLKGKEQIPIKARDLKENIKNLAIKAGLKVYEAACGANMEANNLGCIACHYGPCGNLENLPDINIKELKELLKRLDIDADVEFRNHHEITLRLKKGNDKIAYHWIKELTRRKVLIKH